MSLFLPLNSDLFYHRVAVVYWTTIALEREFPFYYEIFGKHIRLMKAIGMVCVP